MPVFTIMTYIIISINARGLLFVLNTSDWLSFVPKKLLEGLVPLLPVVDQLCAKDAVNEPQKKITGKIYFFITKI